LLDGGTQDISTLVPDVEVVTAAIVAGIPEGTIEATAE
jgi:hypothetical protein